MTRIILSVLLAFYTLAGFSQDKTIPVAIQVNSKSKLIMHAYAKGVQIYICQRDPKDSSNYIWVFLRPKAILYSDSTYHQIIGKHYFDNFARPIWKNVDGSAVTAIKLQQVNSPDSQSIPWVLLKAAFTQGAGVLKSTKFVQRLFTIGGKAPAKARKDQLGQIIQASYTAEYLFYSAE